MNKTLTSKVKKVNAKKTMEQKKEYLINKLSSEVNYIKQNNKLELLKNGMNKKMESYYFFLPNINTIKAFNEFCLIQESLTNELKLLNDFTLNNTICNEDRCYLCSQYCYCEKAKFYKNNISSRFNILLSYLMDSKKFFDRIQKEICFNDIDLIRIHTEGDFFSTEYLSQWLTLAKKNKDVKFYTYTKQFELFDHVKRLPKNFTLQLSFDVNSTYNIPMELLKKGNVNIYLTYDNMDNVNLFIEKHGLQKMKVVDCYGKCRKCRNCYTNKGSIHLCKIH